MTIREKASMFFESILEEVDKIKNPEIKAKALQGLLKQTEYQLTHIKQFIKGDNNGNTTNG
jgi:hypothetical protein